MSYEPTNWQNGDTITAEKLNNMESGIEAAEICLVTMHYNTTLQKWVLDSPSFAEMESAYNSGKRLVLAVAAGNNVTEFYSLKTVVNGKYSFTSAFIGSGTGTSQASCGVTEYLINGALSDVFVEKSISYPYTKPDEGIPETDLDSTVASKLNKASTAFIHTSFVQALGNGWEVQAEKENADIESDVLNVGACFLIVEDANAEEWYIALTEIDRNGRYVGIGEINGRVVRVIAYGTDHALVQHLDEPFIVTLTPAAQDFSGVMDKTPAEIAEAYNFGRRIRFEIPSLYAAVDATQYITAGTNVQASANITYEVQGMGHMLIQVLTDSANSTYSTVIYPLTPMS